MDWGIYDTVDRVWIGDDYGPKLYEDKWVAMVAASIIDKQLDTEPGRHRATPYDHTGTRLRDEVETGMSALEALAKLEEGDL